MLLRAERITKCYLRNTGRANNFSAVDTVDFTLPEHSLTVLTGRSGSGKTTFLQMLAGLLTPSAGRICAGEEDLYAMTDKELSRFRNLHISVIPQGKAVVFSLTVLENVALPRTLYHFVPQARLEAQTLLARLGICELAGSYPAELSGGELRRLAIARALINRPDILLADEPTGDLDDENTLLVLHLLRETADTGTAVLLVTHEAQSFSFADHVFRMDAGVLSRMS